MTGDDQTTVRVDIADTQTVPRGEDPVGELEAELRSAREVMAVRESQQGSQGPPTVPAHVTSPRLAKLTEAQLEAHIDRLEEDLRTVREGWEAVESGGVE